MWIRNLCNKILVQFFLCCGIYVSHGIWRDANPKNFRQPMEYFICNKNGRDGLTETVKRKLKFVEWDDFEYLSILMFLFIFLFWFVIEFEFVNQFIFMNCNQIKNNLKSTKTTIKKNYFHFHNLQVFPNHEYLVYLILKKSFLDENWFRV